MTQVHKIPGVAKNFQGPKFYPHQIMSKGSLLLVEPSHKDCQFTLTDNAVVPNVAKKTAMAMLGAGTTEAQVSGVFKAGTTGGIPNGKYMFEKTSSGALHGIVSQDGTKFTLNTDGGGIDFASSAIFTYMKNNPTHNFFIGIKGRITRAGGNIAEGGTIYPFLLVIAGSAFTANRIAYFTSTQTIPNGVNVPSPVASFAANNQLRLDFARYGYTRNSIAGSASLITSFAVLFGRFSPNSNSSMYSGFPSWILHNLYIEDLTVSGRTETEVAEAYTKWHDESIAEGGIYHGETYTSPSLIP